MRFNVVALATGLGVHEVQKGGREGDSLNLDMEIRESMEHK